MNVGTMLWRRATTGSHLLGNDAGKDGVHVSMRNMLSKLINICV